MNLREQIEKEITEKVMVKLASEKVELGLVDDLKKQRKKIDGIGKKFDRAIDNFNNTLAMARKEYAPIQAEFQDFANQVEKYNQDGQKYLSAIKELGLNPKDQREYSENDYKAILGMLKGSFEQASSMMKGIKR